MQTLYLEAKRLNEFILGLSQTHRVFLPFKKDEDYFYTQFSKDKEFLFNPYRTVEPLKSFFTYAREGLGKIFTDTNYLSGQQPTAIFGVKNCDLTSLKVQDYVYKQGIEVDPVYNSRRLNTLIISSDCTNYKNVCFCLNIGINPYPESGFDLNMSFLNHGFIIELGSDKGKEVIDRFKHLFIPTKDSQLSGQRLKRENFIEKLKDYLSGLNLAPVKSLQSAVKKGYDNMELWNDFMLTCVECGACNFICPACHCFLLEDRIRENSPVRSRIWDSCLYLNYSRVAGGANPLNTRAKRLRNRFMKKFDFFPDNLAIFGCTGCGRCIEACPGKIDIREVLNSLHQGKKTKISV